MTRAKKGVSPTGDDAMPHDHVVARDERDGQVFGETEDWVGLTVLRVDLGVFKFEDTLAEVCQHLADVPHHVEVFLPRQLSNLLAGHSRGLSPNFWGLRAFRADR